MKISKLLIASLIFSTSVLGTNLKGNATQPESPSNAPIGTTSSPVSGTPDTIAPTMPRILAETHTSSPSSSSTLSDNACGIATSNVVPAICAYNNASSEDSNFDDFT
jgi:hypothetical protein